MNQEKWKPVAGFSGFYEVSDHGRIRSRERVSATGRRLKSKTVALVLNGNDSYLRVNLRDHQGTHTVKLVHRIVAETFIDNPSHKPEVNHKDGNKRNNHVTNLEWCTPSENQQHALKNGLRKLNSSSHSKRVGMFQENGELIRVFPSVAEAHRATQASIWSIYARCEGRVDTKLLGYIWKYV